ncbi:MAG: hypothetical protein ACE5DK_06685 [Paracoccaceae bacterium]
MVISELKSPLPVYSLGLSGTLTGLLSWLVFYVDLDFISQFLGVFFGLAVGGCLYRFHRLSVWKSLIVVAIFGLSWQLATRFAIRFNSGADDMVVTGILAGALGAAVLVVGFAALFQGFRRIVPVARTVVIGALAGALLGLEGGYGSFLLFIVWQTAIGASLGLEKGAFSEPNAR